MQNKPNLLNAEMNVSRAYTEDYENEIAFVLEQNKPNTNPNKPNSKSKRSGDPRMSLAGTQSNPKQTQNKAIFKRRHLPTTALFLPVGA